MSLSLVVGAGGFVGSHLYALLERRGDDVHRVSSAPGIPSWHELHVRDSDEAAIAGALAGVQRIFFVAGAAHEIGVDAAALQRLNVDAPLRWLRAADRAGVARFVWLSSIKVLGDVSVRPFTPTDEYRPADAYARSKATAERALLDCVLANATLAIVRPPLVYGPRVRGNFARLLRWADGPLPLPLGRATAPRSLVAVNNLCDLLARLGDASMHGVFHVADTGDVCTRDLVREVRRLLNRPLRELSVPPAWLRAGARLLGGEATFQRLFEPLQVDSSATRTALDWSPPQTAYDALLETVTWFRTSR